MQLRMLSQLAKQATKDLAKTPSGANPYEAMNIELTQKTTMEEITKQFKVMAAKHHPDRKGGSNDKMADLNAAHKTVRQNHAKVLEKMVELEKQASKPVANLHKQAGRVSRREEQRAKSGGISRDQQNVKKANERQKLRSQKEIELAWASFRDETQDMSGKMVQRFEVAIEQGIYFRKPHVLSEVAVRERWLRKVYIKNVWQEVHEMRSELIQRGNKSLQQAELMEDMVSFASAVQKRLNEDYQRQLQGLLRASFRIHLVRFITVAFQAWGAMYFCLWFYRFCKASSFSVQFKDAFFS